MPQSFPSAPRKVSEEQSSPVAAAGGMAGEEKLGVSIPSDGSPREEEKNRKPEEEKTLPPHLPCCSTTSCSLRAREGPSRSWPRAPGGPCARRPRTYLGRCHRSGAHRVLRAPSGRSWLRQPPRWLHRRRCRLRAAPEDAPCRGADGPSPATGRGRAPGRRPRPRGAHLGRPGWRQSLGPAGSAAGPPPPPPAVI